MSDLEEVRRSAEPRQLLRLLEQLWDRVGRHEKRLDNLHDRLLLVDELPASAPFGALLRLTTGPAAGRTPIYVGNGPNQPLSKLTPTPL